LKFRYDKKVVLEKNNQDDERSSILLVESLQGYSITYEGKVYSDIIAIINGNLKNQILLFSVSLGKVLSSIEGHLDELECLFYIQSNKILVSSSLDRTIMANYLQEGKRVFIYTLSDQVRSFTHLKGYLNDTLDDFIACGMGNLDKSIGIYKLSDEKRYKSLVGHGASVLCVSYLGNNKLASGGYDKTMRIWDLDKGECICLVETKVSVLSMTYDLFTKLLFCGLGRNFNMIKVFTVEGKFVENFKFHKGLIWGAHFYRDENLGFLITGDSKGVISIFAGNNNKLILETSDICINTCKTIRENAYSNYYSVFCGSNQSLLIYKLI
jgi:WD40 repeat protein